MTLSMAVWEQRVRKMEFRMFLNAFMRIPCQIIESGRRLIYRLLSGTAGSRSSTAWRKCCAVDAAHYEAGVRTLRSAAAPNAR